MKHAHKYEHGVAHVLALLGLVLLVGIVGFVGYSAWQRSQANAGGTWTVGNPNYYDAGKPATYRYGKNNLCRMYHSLYGKVVVAEGQKSVIEITSNGTKILSYDTAKQKAGTRYFTSSSYVGSFEDAAVRYSVKTPTTKTVTVKAKNGKNKNVTKTTWSESASAILVSDLPRCVPTSDVSEFNFHRGYVCENNGEIVVRYYLKENYVKKYGKGKFIVTVDGRVVKTVNLTNKDQGQYYFRVSGRGKSFKLDFAYGNAKPQKVLSTKMGAILSCL